MPFSSGTFTRDNGVNTGATTWATDASAGTNILTSRHDNHDQDIANGLSTCLLKNGTQTVTANIPFAGFKLNNIGSGTSRTDAINVGQIQDAGVTFGGTSSGAANTYAISLSPAISAYSAGAIYTFKAHQTNTATSTLNINSVGAKTLRTNGTSSGFNLAGGEIQLNELCAVMYDATADVFILLNPFNGWLSYTPTIGALAPMTTSASVINYAKFKPGKNVRGVVQATFTLGGTASNRITCSLPTTASTALGIGAAGVSSDSSNRTSTVYGGSTSQIFIEKYDGTNYTLGASRSIQIEFQYEAA